MSNERYCRSCKCDRHLVDPAWALSELELRRLRNWLYNYNGPPGPESARETVDLAIDLMYTYRRALLTHAEENPFIPGVFRIPTGSQI